MFAQTQDTLNGADTAWVLVCAALVMFMVPGLAFFYAGMVRGRNVLTMMQQNFIALGVVSLAWLALGYNIAFGDDSGTGIIGSLGLFDVSIGDTAPARPLHTITAGVAIPALAFLTYQMMFAVITPALITGATADRLKATGWVAFLVLWSIIVYAPVAHWLWGPDGWLSELGAQDWAGGIVVHASAGAAVLAMLLVVGRRRNWPNVGGRANSLPLTLIGAGILWFGWFGFNAGDGLSADILASQAALNTHLAAATGMCVWLIVERIKDGHASVLGGVSGAVAGLATVTPCAGYVNTASAVAIGALAGLICHLALRLKALLRFDDALDVVAVHFVGGVLGALLLGLFADRSINSQGSDGLFFGGGATLLGYQALALITVVAFSFAITWLIAVGIDKTVGLRVKPADEDKLDHVQQGMEAYHTDHASSLIGSGPVQNGQVHVRPEDGTPTTLRLITQFLDIEQVDPDHLRNALLEAGAKSIAVSDARVYTGHTDTRIVRGVRTERDFPPRLRIDVLVSGANVSDVMEALDRYTTDRSEGFAQDAYPTGTEQPS
jgi:Amt family ammonium transporter